MDRDELGILFFTGGTTGEPKGCMHPVTAPLAVVHVSECIYPGGIRESDVFGGTPPLPFTYGYHHAMLIPFYFGATVSLLQGRATPETAMEAVGRHGVTLFHSVPSMYRMILNMPDVEKTYQARTLRACYTASAPIPVATIKEWKERFGQEIINVIGSHELLGSFIATWKAPFKPGSLGYPYPGYESAILDERGKECPAGETGKLALKGPTGAMYWNQPEEQKKAVVNGWSLTGDAAYKDPDGCIWHVSRTDDIIKSRGYRISPEEVENSLNEHPAVAECGVIGVPDEVQGERVKAFVVLRPGFQPSEKLVEDLKTFCRARIAPYAVPSVIEFIDSLPRTDLLKLSRVALRQTSAAAKPVR
jgi:2-aminobenzoate-CoA ligase